MVEETVYHANAAIAVDSVSQSLVSDRTEWLCDCGVHKATPPIPGKWLKPICSAPEPSQNFLNLNLHGRHGRDLSTQPGDWNASDTVQRTPDLPLESLGLIPIHTT